jgi:hypothetical protein
LTTNIDGEKDLLEFEEFSKSLATSMEGTKEDDLANFLSVRISFSMTGCNIVKHALRTTLSKTTTLKVETAEDFNDAVIEV